MMPTLSALVPSEVVRTTYGATSGDKIGILMHRGQDGIMIRRGFR